MMKYTKPKIIRELSIEEAKGTVFVRPANIDVKDLQDDSVSNANLIDLFKAVARMYSDKK